jgi:tryptophan 2,3-dioxygenase
VFWLNLKEKHNASLLFRRKIFFFFEANDKMPFGAPQDKENPLSYGGYLKIPEIISLQNLLSNPPAHDEMLFIIIHQIYELWFKELLHELEAIRKFLEEDVVLDAIRLLRRCIEIGRILVAQVAVLETMTPMDFLDFRDNLMPASGFQSFQFREIEYLSGLKDARFLENYSKDSEEYGRLKKRLEEPSLWDVFCALFLKRLKAPAKDEKNLLQALKQIYEKPRENFDLFLLCESFIEYDETILHWRLIHVKMVERMIGSKTGTGGSEGVGYLKTTLDRKFFPLLWELRTYLSKRPASV